MISSITQDYYTYAVFIEKFFSWYWAAGRNMLDFLHRIFSGLFDVLLYITFAVSFFYLVMSLYILFKKQKRTEQKYEGGLPSVTVQIPTYKEIVAVRCAQACLEFDYPK